MADLLELVALLCNTLLLPLWCQLIGKSATGALSAQKAVILHALQPHAGACHLEFPPLRASLLAFTGNEVGYSALSLDWAGPGSWVCDLLLFWFVGHPSPRRGCPRSIPWRACSILSVTCAAWGPPLVGLGPPFTLTYSRCHLVALAIGPTLMVGLSPFGASGYVPWCDNCCAWVRPFQL